MSVNTGGPAFPKVSQLIEHNGEMEWGSDGMTLRDYLAAHAPPRPDWFEPSLRPLPELVLVDELIDAITNGRSGELFDGEYLLHPEGLGYLFGEEVSSQIQDIAARGDAAQSDRALWHHERRFQLVAQWPWTYADLVIAARDRGTK